MKKKMYEIKKAKNVKITDRLVGLATRHLSIFLIGGEETYIKVAGTPTAEEIRKAKLFVARYI